MFSDFSDKDLELERDLDAMVDLEMERDLDTMVDLEMERDLYASMEEELVSHSQSFLQSCAFDPDSGKCMYVKGRSHSRPNSFKKVLPASESLSVSLSTMAVEMGAFFDFFLFLWARDSSGFVWDSVKICL